MKYERYLEQSTSVDRRPGTKQVHLVGEHEEDHGTVDDGCIQGKEKEVPVFANRVVFPLRLLGWQADDIYGSQRGGGAADGCGRFTTASVVLGLA